MSDKLSNTNAIVTNTIDTVKNRLFAITVHDIEKNPIAITSSAHNLEFFSFLYRNAAKETIDTVASFIVNRSCDNQHQLADNLNGICKCFRDPGKKFMIYVAKINNLCVCCVTDNEYDRNVCISLMNKITKDISQCSDKEIQKILDQYITKYRNSDDMNKILQIHKELDVVKDTMISNIDTLLKQGETLDDLVKKSETMSNSSKTLLITARKFNRCPGCAIL